MAQQQRRVQSCSLKLVIERVGTPRGSKQTCIPMRSDLYKRIWDYAAKVRHLVARLSSNKQHGGPIGQ